MEKELICIICPCGCKLKIDENLKVTGNICPRGEAYAKSEISHPVRIVTSTVEIKGSALQNRLPVKTDKPVSKDLMFKVMKEIRGVSVEVPIHIGDVIIKNVAGTDANVVATRNIKK